MRVTIPTIRWACPSVCLSVCPSVRQHFGCKHDNSINTSLIDPKLIQRMYLENILINFEDGFPYGEAVLILVLFRVLFLVSNEAKECSTQNSTPLFGSLFVVFSLKSFGVLKIVPFGVPFGVRQLFKLTLRLALDTSLICRSLVLNGVLKAVPNGVLKGVLFAVLHSKRSVVCGV